MTDHELLVWLRDQSMHCFRNNAFGAQVYVDAIADRLEELTRLAPPAPVSAARLAEMRERAHDNSSFGRPTTSAMLCDALALFDHERRLRQEAECFAARFVQDSEACEAGVKLGVAKALAAIESLGEEMRSAEWCMALNAIHDAAGGVAEPLPPHERSLARLAGLEATVTEIVRIIEAYPGEDPVSELTAIERVAKVALEAAP